MKRKFILYLILALMFVVSGGVGFYYWYEGTYYVTTEDARVSGDVYRIMPRISGKLTSLTIEDGDRIVADQIVGEQDTSNLSTNLLDNAALHAPISGIVMKTSARIGEVVSPGQSVALVVDDSKLYVTANIEETKIGRVKVGQQVDITVDAFPDKVLTGKVEKVGEATNSTFSLLPSTNTSGNFTKVVQRLPVKVAIDSQDGLAISPGMNTLIKIHVKG